MCDYSRAIAHKSWTKSNEQKVTSNKQNVTSNEQKVRSNEQKVTSNEQRVTSNENKLTSKKQKVTNSEQKVTSNKQKVTSNEQKVTSNEQKVQSRLENDENFDLQEGPILAYEAQKYKCMYGKAYKQYLFFFFEKCLWPKPNFPSFWIFLELLIEVFKESVS